MLTSKEALFKFMKRKEQIDQLKDMSVHELNEQADALKDSLFRLKFRKTRGVGDTIKALCLDIDRMARNLQRYVNDG